LGTVGAFYEKDYYKDLGIVTRPPWTMVLSREAFYLHYSKITHRPYHRKKLLGGLSRRAIRAKKK
jgi:hypothetical protein